MVNVLKGSRYHFGMGCELKWVLFQNKGKWRVFTLQVQSYVVDVFLFVCGMCACVSMWNFYGVEKGLGRFQLHIALL